jgi:very-short-patch-repair endonuclease/uncharacterized protein YoaH (UPF0181 family)
MFDLAVAPPSVKAQYLAVAMLRVHGGLSLTQTHGLTAKRQSHYPVHSVADASVASVRNAFLRSIPKDPVEDIESAQNVVREWGLALVEDLADVLQRVAVASAQVHATKFRAPRFAELRTALDSPGVAMKFDVSNPRAIEWARAHAAELVVEITQDTQEMIAKLISRGIAEGRTIKETAKLIREVIGLTSKQGLSLLDLRDKLEAQGYDDPDIEDEIRARTNTMINVRADLIAHTESMTASNFGQQLLWDQAVDEGYLTGTEKKEWITTPDERLAVVGAKTLVLTIDGWRAISDIKVGDQVLTHKDRFRRVEAIFSHGWYHGPVVRVSMGGLAGFKVTVTPEHALWVQRGGQKMWVAAQDLQDHDLFHVNAVPCTGCGKLLQCGRDRSAKRTLCHECSSQRNNAERWARPGAREAHAEHNAARWARPGEHERASAAKTGATQSPEVRKRLSDLALERYEDPEVRAKQAARNRLRAESPTHGFRTMTAQRRAEIRHLAAKGRGAAARGASFLEKKMRWFLEKQGIAFEPQWPFPNEDRTRFHHADFYLPGPNLVVECDGHFHTLPEQQDKDRERDKLLVSMGVGVLRFDNDAIRYRFAEVASAIRSRCCLMTLPAKSVEVCETNHQPCYDLRVEEDESFIAGGIVVHNCPICGSMDGKLVGLKAAFDVDGVPRMVPPAHPRCRCTVGISAESPRFATSSDEDVRSAGSLAVLLESFRTMISGSGSGNFGHGGREGHRGGSTGKKGVAGAKVQEPQSAKSALTPTRTRAFSADSASSERMSKLETGALGEKLAIEYLKSLGFKDARTLNEVGNNFPVDLIQDHEAIEVKTGLASNGASAQQWRATIGQPGVKERAWLAKASDSAKKKWNLRKQQEILDRKAEAIDTVSKRVGHRVKGKTLTTIINPSTRTVDIYEFTGFHLRIAWNSDKAKEGYRGSFKY